MAPSRTLTRFDPTISHGTQRINTCGVKLPSQAQDTPRDTTDSKPAERTTVILRLCSQRVTLSQYQVRRSQYGRRKDDHEPTKVTNKD
jgi:hypothetical protein